VKSCHGCLDALTRIVVIESERASFSILPWASSFWPGNLRGTAVMLPLGGHSVAGRVCHAGEPSAQKCLRTPVLENRLRCTDLKLEILQARIDAHSAGWSESPGEMPRM
jgi:hypothetical protein